MTRCLDERELFAAMDAGIPAARREHLAACPACAARVERLSALRSAARAATAPAEPDWDRLETRIRRSIRTAAAPRPVRWMPVPVALSAAAALLVALAIAVGRTPEVAPPAGPAPRVAAAIPAARVDARVPLAAAVAERFGTGAPARGLRVLEGCRVEYAAQSGARLAIGDDIAVDEIGPAGMEVASLDEWRPTIRLDSGAFRIEVVDGALPQELVVLAARTEFTVFSGSAEVILVDDVLELRAIDGPLAIAFGGELRELAAGEGLRRGGAEGLAVASGWTALPPAWEGTAATDMPLLDLDRPTGTLPKQIVRDVLRASTVRLRACYETALKRYPALEELPLTARLRVGTGGRVARVRVAGAEAWPELGRCLSDVLGGLRFPAPVGGEVDLIAPLRLQPLQ